MPVEGITMPAPRPLHILETCLYARDLHAMEQFYVNVMGLPKMSEEYPRHVFFQVSPQSVLLIFNPEETIKEQEVPSHGATGPTHIAFAIAPQDLQVWRDHLTGFGVTVEREITWPNGARSLYFRDPGGNSVEVVTQDIWRETPQEDH